MRSAMAARRFLSAQAARTKTAKPSSMKTNKTTTESTVLPLRNYLNYQDLRLPGARILHLNADENQPAEVNSSLLVSLRDRLEGVTKNEYNEIIGFQSRSPSTFAHGINPLLPWKEQKETLLRLQEWNASLSQCSALSVVSLEGEVTDAGLSLFQSAKYHIGTPTLSFRVASLSDQGRVPVGGVFSSLLRGRKDLLSLVRVLSLSGVSLSAQDLLDLGLFHSLCPTQTLSPLCLHLAQSALPLSASVAQPKQTDVSLFAQAVSSFALSEPRVLEDTEAHPVWESVLAVPPSQMPRDPESGLPDTEIPRFVQNYAEFRSLQREESLSALRDNETGADLPQTLEMLDSLGVHLFGDEKTATSTPDFAALKTRVSNYEKGIEKTLLSEKNLTFLRKHGAEKERVWRFHLQQKLFVVSQMLKTLEKIDAKTLELLWTLTSVAAEVDTVAASHHNSNYSRDRERDREGERKERYAPLSPEEVFPEEVSSFVPPVSLSQSLQEEIKVLDALSK